MKTIISITLAIALLVSLCACSESGDNEVLAEQPPEEQTTPAKTEKEDESDITQLRVTTFYGVGFTADEDGNYRNSILEEANIARLLSEEELENDSNQRQLELWNMEDFYCLDNFKVDGLKLNHAQILGHVFNYYFAPNGEDNFGNFDISWIELRIMRTDKTQWEGAPTTIEEHAQTYHHNLANTTIVDNLFVIQYRDPLINYSRFGGLLGDTWFSAMIPSSFDLDSAIELGRRLIATAELINVSEELARLQ